MYLLYNTRVPGIEGRMSLLGLLAGGGDDGPSCC